MKVSVLRTRPLAVAALGAVVAVALPATALFAGPHRPNGPRGPGRSIQGVVVYYNHSPKGPCDSVMLQAGDKFVQVNLSPEEGPAIKEAFAAGDHVTVTAVPEDSKGDHSVVRAQTIRGTDGRQFTLGPKGPPRPGPLDTIRGKIKWLNFARHGEVNGAVLENGDFVHLGPHANAEFQLAVGQMLTVEGPARPLSGGHRMIEHAVRVNGQELQHGPPRHGPPPPRPLDR